MIQIPVAHGEGNYYCDEETLAKLEANLFESIAHMKKILMVQLKILLEFVMKRECLRNDAPSRTCDGRIIR